MIKKVSVLFLILLTGAFYNLTSADVSPGKGAVPLVQFCKEYNLHLKINLDLGYCDLVNDGVQIRLFLTMPYLVHQNKVYYFDVRLGADNSGGILLPKTYADTLIKIVKKYTEKNPPLNGKVIETEHFVNIEKLTNTQKKTNAVSVKPGIHENFIQIEQGVTNQKSGITVIEEIKPVKMTNQKSTNGLKSDKTPPTCYNNDGFVPINAVIIDAGHGGNDPGALGKAGGKEKDIVLKLAKMVYQHFKSEQGMKVFLTRKSDVFVTLEDRVAFSSKVAKDYHAVFVSLHANASPMKTAQGIEVYYLSDNVSDMEATQLEIYENAGFSKTDVEKTEVLYSIIADLIHDGIKLESEQMANFVYKTLVNITKAPGRGVKAGNFYVLKYNPIPAILVEVGFISSREEEQRLLTTDYQMLVAKGLFYGIKKYVSEYNKTKGFCQ
jgi:N-acetylmuramoyl-L-alanine amidase